jgi:hypothetical protein
MFDAHLKGRTFGAEYYRDNILTALVCLCPERGGRELVIHADNAKGPYGSKAHRLLCGKRAWTRRHPPSSLHHAPSDFVLFGHVKHCLHGIAVASHEELLAAFGETVTDIPKEKLSLSFP